MRFLSIIILCFLVAGNVNAQTDWQEHKSPVEADLHNIFFVSNSVGWIVTHSTGAILQTKDAGKNWIVQARHDSISYEDIYFLDENTGWISGEKGLLLNTTDGGKHWLKQQITDKENWIYAVHFTNMQNGISVGMRPSRPLTVFLKTNNGGNTWSSLGKGVPEAFYTDITFINKKDGYSGGLQYILHTRDGGNSWQKQFPDSTMDANEKTVIRDISFVSDQNGWAVGHRGLVLKTENGESWSKLATFTKNRLRDIAFVNQSEGYIVGDSNKEPGVLYHTNNGGKTWQTVLSDAPDLHRIEITESKIWLVGDDGTILSTSR